MIFVTVKSWWIRKEVRDSQMWLVFKMTGSIIKRIIFSFYQDENCNLKGKKCAFSQFWREIKRSRSREEWSKLFKGLLLQPLRGLNTPLLIKFSPYVTFVENFLPWMAPPHYHLITNQSSIHLQFTYRECISLCM